jgi:outer membrane receptor protein involved in Fe transport
LQTRIENLGAFTLTGFMVRQHEAIVLSGETVDYDGRILELYLNRNQEQLGVEMESRFLPWFNRVEFFLNSTVLLSRFDQDGHMQNNAEYPDLLANAGLYYTHDHLDLNLFCKYVSSFESARFAADGLPKPLGNFLALNATVGWTFGRKFRTRIYLEMHNLADSRYSTVVGYPDFGRRFIFGFAQDIK